MTNGTHLNQVQARSPNRRNASWATSLVIAWVGCCALLATTMQILPSLVKDSSTFSTRTLLSQAFGPPENHGVENFLFPSLSSVKPSTKRHSRYKLFDCPLYDKKRMSVSSSDAVKTTTNENNSTEWTLTVDDDPNGGKLFARWTVTTPSFWVALNPKAYDSVRWGLMDLGRYYEKQLTAVFQTILRGSPPHAIVLDVGSNIGWFSLVSRAMGHPVYAFEANPLHLLRICESVKLNEWNYPSSAPENDVNIGSGYNWYAQHDQPPIELYNYGVSDHHDTRPFRIPKGEPGSASFHIQGKPRKDDNVTTMSLLTLDGFAQDRGWIANPSSTVVSDVTSSSNPIAILKIDVESWEGHVLKGAQQLLASGLVENVLMEFSLIGSEPPKRPIKRLVEVCKILMGSSYKLYQWGYWLGPARPFNSSDTSVDTLDHLKTNCITKGKGCNLWWKHNSSKNDYKVENWQW